MRNVNLFGRIVFALALCLTSVVSVAPAAAEEVTLKMATLAPRGSSWAKLFELASDKIAKDTGGRVKFKWFFGGQQGDEKDVTRKMKLDQLDGGAVTAVGLGVIQPDVLVFQLPLMWKSEKQLDYVREKMAPQLEEAFVKSGYILLAWGDVGWTHWFSKEQVKSMADLGKVKMWVWDVDPIAKSFFGGMGINGVPLGVPEVKTALGTGLINACYGAFLSTVALQWYTDIKFASSTPVGYAIGALIISKKAWDKVSAADQTVVRKHSAILGQKLLKSVRADNGKAKNALVKSGVQFVDIPTDVQAKLESSSQKTWAAMAGKVYSKAVLDEVLKHRAAAPQ